MDMVARLPLGGRRWQRYGKTLRFAGVDLTGADMRLQIRLYRNAPGTPVIDLSTVTNGNAEGLRLIGVEQVNGKPVSTVALVINETTMEGTPFMGEAGDDSMFAYDMQVTPPGGYKQVWLEGEFWVLAAVTGAENATPGSTSGYSTSRPTRPSLAAGSSEFQIGDSVIQVEIAAPSGPKGDSAVPSQRYDFTAVAGQSRVPASGPLVDNNGKPFSEGLNFATLIVNNKTIAPELYSYGGGNKPVTLAGGFVFTAGDKVTVIAQPYATNVVVPAGEGVLLHTYPGTTAAEDPYRLNNDNAKYAAAQADVRNPDSVNFGKIIFAEQGKGSAQLNHMWSGNLDPVTGKAVPAYARPRPGCYMFDAWSQNGAVLQETPTVIYANVGTSPGNLMSDTRLHLLPGAGIMRPPRPDFGGILRPLMICGDPNKTSATTVNGIDKQSDVFNNVEIICHGSAAFYGENYRYGFREHFNDISLNGASDFNIVTHHYGFMSDSLYVGAGNFGGGGWNRHNKRGRIDLFVDGLNRLNRNAVSVIDCTVLDGSVTAYRTSRIGGPGDNPFSDVSGRLAPGVVDFEPNDFTDDPRIDACRLHVYAEDCGSSAVATLLIDNDKIPVPLGSIHVTGKAVRCRQGNHTMIGGTDMATPYDVVIEVGQEDCENPGQVLTGQGCRWRNIRSIGSNRPILIGYSSFAAVQDFWIENCYFQELGALDTAAIQIRGWQGGGFINTQIVNGANRGLHLLSNGGTSPIRDLIFDGLEFINRANITGQSMSVAIDVDPSNGGPQLFPSTIIERDIRYKGIPNNRWAVAGSYVKNIPGFGPWEQGQECYGHPTLEPGSPRVLRTFAGNTSGPPFWYQQELIQPVPDPSPLGGSATANGFVTNNMRVENLGSGMVRLTATGPNARWMWPSPVSSFTLNIHAPFSGTQTVYAGGFNTPTPTNAPSPTNQQLVFGQWLYDTTGGVLGFTRGIVSGGASGSLAGNKYGDRFQIGFQSSGTAAVYKLNASNGQISPPVTTTGVGAANLYPGVLILVPGESVIVRGATI